MIRSDSGDGGITRRNDSTTTAGGVVNDDCCWWWWCRIQMWMMMMMRLIRNSRRTSSSTAGWGTIRREYIGSTFLLLRVILLATWTTVRRCGCRGIYIYIKLVKLWDGGWWKDRCFLWCMYVWCKLEYVVCVLPFSLNIPYIRSSFQAHFFVWRERDMEVRPPPPSRWNEYRFKEIQISP